MSHSMLQEIEDTRLALVSAFESHDWERVGQLDLQCRDQVDVAMLECTGAEEDLRSQLEALLDVYCRLTDACLQHRNHAADELSKLARSTQGAKVYQMFS